MANIKLIRLVTGEELLADIIPHTGNGGNVVSLKNIATIGYLPNRNQQGTPPAIGIGPWVPYRDMKQEVEIKVSHILCILNPLPDMITEYNKMFSPIVAPISSLILPR